jgi:hypothetical protein
VHVLKLATFCTSQPQFIAQFKAFLDDDTLFLPSKVALSIGQTVEFSICLQDERPMLEGRGEVVHVRPNIGGRAERTGLRVRVRELTPSSRTIRDAIISARNVAKGPAAPAAAPSRSMPLARMTAAPRSTPAVGNRAVDQEPAAAEAEAVADDDGSGTPTPPLGTSIVTATVSRPPRSSAGAATVTPVAAREAGAPDRGGRLFSQGVQVAVPASPTAHLTEDSDGTPASPLLEVSTRSIVSSIESLADDPRGTASGLTPVTQVESDLRKVGRIRSARREDDAPVAVPTRPGALRVVVPPVLSSLATLAVCWFLWGRAAQQPPPPPVRAAAPITRTAAAPAAVAQPPPAPTAAKASVPAAKADAPAKSDSPAKAEAVGATTAPAGAAKTAAPGVGKTAPAIAARTAPAVEPTPPTKAPPETAPADDRPTMGHCTARITSAPTGAVVSLGTRPLGTTPVEVDHVPCGRFEVTLNRPRYNQTAATVEPGHHGKGSAFVRLVRPSARLVLTSTPPNAVFKVNHNIVSGDASVPRFERAKIEATLPGHKPWKKVVYVTGATVNVNAVLARGH